MTESNYYEIVRQKLKLGPIYAPKHKKIFELMQIFWNEDAIKVLSYFEGIGKMLSPRKLAKISNIPQDEIKETLDQLARRGTILKIGNQYGLLPLLPGIFELYFSVYNDTKENLIKVAELYRHFFDNFLPQQLLNSDFTLFRPLLPYESKEKFIKIDESIESRSQVLPTELAEILINTNDVFVVKPCDCRKIGELSGNPCSLASSEMGCLFCGIAGQFLLDRGIGKQLTKEEAIAFLKETEKAGLVHNAINSSGLGSSMIICNCCSCHCGTLVPFKNYRVTSVTPSNFIPRINNDLCVNCETCLKKCPMGAIYHQWPNEEDSSDECMMIRADFCIGCGVCASNCPKNAILLEKIRDIIPPKNFKIGDTDLLKMLL
ncbi:MAG TPA: 4Fe-4S binding protein [Candidatus Deferrimicrobium sp.]|nr:4Fe-4S binding protein [Candidatus Deferrimicrobium sp.]